MGWLVSADEFEKMARGHRVLHRAGVHTKVIELPDRRIIKLFRTRLRPSSQWIVPGSTRFKRNSARLRRMGIAAPVVERTFFLLPEFAHAAVYPRLEGPTLTEVDFDRACVDALASFIASLHNAGVYFRGLHPANIVRCEDGSFGLLDVVDVSFHRGALKPQQRERNFRHLFRRADNRERIVSAGVEHFVSRYLDACQNLDPKFARMRERLSVVSEYARE